MARVDSFLAQLIAYEADALLIESGENLFLVKGEQRMPLMRVRPGAIGNGHVVTLLGEIAPGELHEALRHHEPVNFEYRWGTCLFRVEVANCEGQLFARLRHIGENAPPPPPPQDLDQDEERPAIERFLRHAFDKGATDLHMTAGRVPMARIHSEIGPLAGFGALEPYHLQRMLEEILPDANKRELELTNDSDFAFDLETFRVRANVFRDRTGVGAVFRLLSRRPRCAEDLTIPATVMELCKLDEGLVIVTGTRGCGKSTTLAAMIDWINANRAVHIVTIESPIEYVHEAKRALVNQRQIGDHTGGYARALQAARREDADVILLGDLPDADSIQLALEIAETGRLVLAPLYARSAAAVAERLVQPFGFDRQEHIRRLIAGNLRAVVGQVLLRTPGHPPGAVFDVLRPEEPATPHLRAA